MFLFSLLPFSLAATYGTFYPIEDMTDLAHDVVSGTVSQIESKMEDGKIISVIDLTITHNYVGNKQDSLQFTVLGGSLNGQTMYVPGSPKFTIGQEVLVFVEQDKIIGFGQGAYHLDSEYTATRSVDNFISESPYSNSVDLAKELPDESQARSCLEVKIWNTYDDDWAMRSLEVDHMAQSEFKVYPLTLVQGMDYQFIACSEEKTDAIQLSIYDDKGNILTENKVNGRELLLEWNSDKTQDIFLSVQSFVNDQEVKQMGTSVGILYR